MKPIFILIISSLVHWNGLFAQLKNTGSLKIVANTIVKVSNDVSNTGVAASLSNAGTLTTAGSITNTDNATLTGDGIYKLATDWTNSATFSAGNSTVQVEGNTLSQISTGGNALNHLILNKANQDITLLSDMTIGGTLTFNADNNKINLGANHLTISQAGNIANFDNNQFVVTNHSGKLVQQNVGNTDVTFPVGFDAGTYNPLIINQSGSVLNMGVRVSEHVSQNGLSGAVLTNGVIDAGWELSQVGTSVSPNLSITAQWNNTDELSGFVRNNCGLSYYTTGWNLTNAGLGASAGADPYTRSRTGITSVGMLTVGTTSAVLPLELLTFTARAINEKVLLQWFTTTEIQMSHFEIEKSADGKNWEFIHQLPSKSVPQSANAYDFTDRNAFERHSIQYYRLKMVHLDKTAAYSPIRVAAQTDKDLHFNVYPIPTHEVLNIEVSSVSNLVFSLTDVLGREWLHGTLQTLENQIDISLLTNGLYQLKIYNPSETWVYFQKVIVQK